MAALEVRVVVRVAWWVRLYLRSVSAFAALHGLSPDVRKVECVMRVRTHAVLLDARGRPARAVQ